MPPFIGGLANLDSLSSSFPFSSILDDSRITCTQMMTIYKLKLCFSAIDLPHGERILVLCVYVCFLLRALMGGSLGVTVRLSHCTLDLFMWTAFWLGWWSRCKNPDAVVLDIQTCIPSYLRWYLLGRPSRLRLKWENLVRHPRFSAILPQFWTDSAMASPYPSTLSASRCE